MRLKKSIIASISLICIGIIFGIVIVSSYSGIRWGFAQDTKLGAQNPPVALENLKAVSDGYVAIAKEIIPKVVMIEVVTESDKGNDRMRDFYKFFNIPDEDRQQAGLGSGIIISSDGYILTNNHIVKNAKKDQIKVVTNDRKEYFAKLIGTDKNTDLAVIKIDADNLPVAYLGNSDNVQVGEIVFAVGNPLGKHLNSTVTHGIVSAIGRNIGIIDNEKGFGIEDFIQTDAAINPGNSGGALVDVNGAVIGINTAIQVGVNQGYGFAIPISLAKKTADDIIKFGKVKRGYLGIRMSNQSIDETMAKALGLPKAYGVLINEVVSGSAAENAGIKAQDVILEVDGKEILLSNQLQEMVARKHPGDEVKLKIFRDGSTFEKTVKLRSLDEDSKEEKKTYAESEDTDESSPKTVVNFEKLGFSIRNMTSEEKKKSKASESVIVDKVKNYSIAQSRGLVSGDIILDIKKSGEVKKVSSVSVVEKIIKGAKAGESLLIRVQRAGTPLLIAIEIPKE